MLFHDFFTIHFCDLLHNLFVSTTKHPWKLVSSEQVYPRQAGALRSALKPRRWPPDGSQYGFSFVSFLATQCSGCVHALSRSQALQAPSGVCILRCWGEDGSSQGRWSWMLI